MTWKLRKSDAAIADLADIWTYIAADNPPAADKLVGELLTLFERTAIHPHLGRNVEDIGERVRIIPRRHYLIIYRILPDDEAIELVRVVHGARDWQALFEDFA